MFFLIVSGASDPRLLHYFNLDARNALRRGIVGEIDFRADQTFIQLLPFVAKRYVLIFDQDGIHKPLA